MAGLVYIAVILIHCVVFTVLFGWSSLVESTGGSINFCLESFTIDRVHFDYIYTLYLFYYYYHYYYYNYYGQITAELHLFYYYIFYYHVAVAFLLTH